MKKITKVVAVALSFGVCTNVVPELRSSALAQSQSPERIDWAKKGRSLVWEAKVAAKSSKFYVFQARKGQTLSLSFIDDTKVGSMDLGKYSVEPNTDPMTMPITVTKDYTLSVTNNSNKATSFRIGFELQDPKAAPALKELSGEYPVRFARGANSAVYSGTLAADPGVGNVTYLLTASKGQHINFVVEGAKDVYVSLALPRAQDPELQSGTGKINDYKVVKSGKHYLTIVNHSGKKTPFTLRLKVLNATPVVAPSRIQLRKGEQVADLKGTLAPKASRKYVAYVVKGNMITIVPQDESTKKIRCRVDGKEFNFLDSTATDHQKVSKDHVIEFYNPTNGNVPFYFWVGFSEHG